VARGQHQRIRSLDPRHGDRLDVGLQGAFPPDLGYIGWQFTDSILSHFCRNTIFFEGSRP
jgi:hypothetical protein